jgi:hypothetical protein
MRTWKPDKCKLKKTIIKDDFKCKEDAILFEADLITNHINDELNRNYHIPPNKFHSFGFVSVKDSDGKIFSVLKSDSRIASGELVGVFKDRKHSYISRQKMSEYHKLHKSNVGDKNTQYNTRWITDGIKSIKIKSNEPVPIDWRYGYVNQNIIGYHWINDGNKNKKLMKDKILPEGWKYGRILSLEYKKW